MDVKSATAFELTHALRTTALVHLEGPMNPRYAEAKKDLRAICTELKVRFQEMLGTARTDHARDEARLGIRLMTNRLAEL